LSEAARETLALMSLLRRTVRAWGRRRWGGHVISMTRAPSDVLTVLWLWSGPRTVDGGHPRDASLRLPIIPLFETIDYLRDAPATMAAVLEVAAYRSYLQPRGNARRS